MAVCVSHSTEFGVLLQLIFISIKYLSIILVRYTVLQVKANRIY